MGLISLMYHDIAPDATTRRYAFARRDFVEHLRALAGLGLGAPSVPGAGGEPGRYALTFDDGHEGCAAAAEDLQERGWKASFFVISGFVGKPGFLDRAGVRRLADMGHAIGTHTVDHRPLPSRDYADILDQWTRSKAELEDITGREILSASVPGGYYDARVARAADAAGLKRLFTSEPVREGRTVGGCRVLGRFALYNGTSAGTVARIASGSRAMRLRQYAEWSLKQAARSIAPGPYMAFRRRVFPDSFG